MFIDVHAHAYKKIGPKQNGESNFPTPEQLIPKYKKLGIEKACLLPLIGPEVYLPESNEEILEICEKYPDTFIPFCNIDPRALTNSAEAPLDYLLQYYRDKGCKGIGEVMPNLPFLDPRVQNLFKHVENVGFPLIFDISTRVDYGYGLVDDPGLPQLEQSLRNFPKLKIFGHGIAFWAEIAKLASPAEKEMYKNAPIQQEGVVPELMRKYENLYGDLSAGSGFNALSRDPDYAVAFINEFQDKLLFGTDICFSEQNVPLVEFLIQMKNTNKISEQVFLKIAKKNAQHILGLK